ncbi:MAG: hypothetical protein Q8877_03450 [Sweet potato little leaf phytoplasma]|nr:hypothetical protein [Sweet potato little leaf phytoplasma]
MKQSQTKTPDSTGKKDLSNVGTVNINFSELDDVDVENMPPKQVDQVLEAIEELKAKLSASKGVAGA